MRWRFAIGALALFAVVGVVLAATLSGPGSLLNPVQAGGLGNSQPTAIAGSNAIVRENMNPGTSSWMIPGGKESTIEIQAYASATSVSPGQRLTFYVSTQRDGAAYSVAIYRLGWYGGLGGRLMSWQGGLIGHAQGYYDELNHRLVNCRSCYVDTRTGLVEANWQASYTLTIPADWTTGVYLAKFIDVVGMQTYAPFDVRGNFSSLYVAVTPDTTYQAYNLWGGYSLYAADNVVHSSENASLPRGVKVSFDRPYADQQGSSQVLIFLADAIHWMERQGYDLSYMSSVDLHEDPAQLLHHRAYLSLGHDEYWTKEMRDGVEHARDSGVSLAFLGADASYWQMRFEPDSAGTPDRTIVCYKVQTSQNDLNLDPFYGVDNSRLTTQWRDPALGRPENALIGIMYSSLTDQPQGFPWRVSPKANSPLLAGTGLRAGQQYGCDLVGYEWDQIVPNGASPAGLRVLGNSSTTNIDDEQDVSNTTYYIAPSGAMVFAAGSIQWTTVLDSYRLHPDALCSQKSLVIPGIQKLMANVMNALIHPASL